jgi:uncharacterized membrane protein
MNSERARRWIIVCSTFELLALSIWIGGLIMIVAAVIPAVFNSLGMEPGGRLLTRVFEGYNRLVLVSAGMLVVGAMTRALLSLSVESVHVGLSRVEWTVAVTMIALAAMVIFVLEPSSVRLQERAFAMKDEVERKAAYESFFKSHTIVRALYVVNLGLAIALIPIKVRSLIDMGRVIK